MKTGWTVVCLLLCIAAFGQNEKKQTALSKKEIAKIDQETKVQPVFEFDSIRVELYHGEERFAILPAYLKSQVNEKYILSTELSADTLRGNKTLLRILLYMKFPGG
ncbi:hypothetical protein WSM22_09790 [Cytophagales bacterium WSM2-2]|nr:hypothetical protein WSM22_09790 [Cytophagales bacterium WSM2-2]